VFAKVSIILPSKRLTTALRQNIRDERMDMAYYTEETA
jgi:hypothetical protein